MVERLGSGPVLQLALVIRRMFNAAKRLVADVWSSRWIDAYAELFVVLRECRR